MDRRKLLIGAFGYSGDFLYTDDQFKDLIDFGADYIIATDTQPELLALCEKYRMPAIINGRVPSWWGGDGENAGHYREKVNPDLMAEYLGNTPVGETVAGDYIVDEPNSKDFTHINQVMQVYSNYYNGKKIPFINLYPNYASVPQNTDEQAISQLGNSTYLEHLEQYVREIDNDYLCFDFYPFTGRPYDTFLQNLDEAAAVCRKSGRDLWVIIQTGAWKKADLLLEFQIRWQSVLSLAYGAKSIIHACYAKQWWDEKTSCVDDNGNKNITYDYAKNVNAELHALGPLLMDYTCLGVYAAGRFDTTDQRTALQLEEQNRRSNKRGFNGFDGVTVTADGGLIVGCFEKNGPGKALMLVNCKNPRDSWACIKTRITVNPKSKATLYTKGHPQEIDTDSAGNLQISIESGEGIFLTLSC